MAIPFPLTFTGAFVGAWDGITTSCLVADRRVRSAYSGAVLRVRRASDNAELDIGYLADGSLDDSAIDTFRGASSAFLVTRYDQSGNARHVTQSVTANQPVWVPAAIGGKGTFSYDGNNDYMFSTTLPVGAVPFTVYVTYQPTAGAQTSQRSLWGIGDSGSTNYFDLRVNALSTTGTPVMYVGTGSGTHSATATLTMVAGTSGMIEARWIAANSRKIRLNGANEGTDTNTLTPVPVDQHFVGRSAFSTIEAKGYLPEVGVLGYDPTTAQRNQIGAAQSYWGATVAVIP